MKWLVIGLWVIGCWSCSPNNVKIDNSLKKYFDENKVEGCFGLYENATGQFTIYNLPRYRDSAYLPASTFKIVNALVGLQTGRIVNDSMLIKWDGIKRPDERWNKDLTMYEAFQVSAVPYFQEVARRIGKDTLQFWLDSLAYGTKKISTRVDTFWLDNSLKIKPDEELGLVKKLYFNQLPFFKSNQEIVKRAMTVEDNSNYKLCYKTGWGWDETAKKHIGWITGWIEENRHPYFFVLNIETPVSGTESQAIPARMLKELLGQFGLMQGKK